MFRIYHIVESPLLTQLLVCLFSSWNLFSSRCRLVYKVTQFQVFLFLKLDFDVMIISKFMFRKNQLYSWWNLNVITLPGWMRMKTKKNNCLWWRCIQRHLALILLLYFWSKGDILSQAPSHFPSRSFTLTAIICLNSRTNCSKANNLFKPLFSLYEIWSTDCFEFSVETIYAKKNKRSEQYNPFEPPNVPILFIEQTIK